MSLNPQLTEIAIEQLSLVKNMPVETIDVIETIAGQLCKLPGTYLGT